MYIKRTKLFGIPSFCLLRLNFKLKSKSSVNCVRKISCMLMSEVVMTACVCKGGETTSKSWMWLGTYCIDCLGEFVVEPGGKHIHLGCVPSGV